VVAWGNVVCIIFLVEREGFDKGREGESCIYAINGSFGDMV
jgi:hypothetical protein